MLTKLPKPLQLLVFKIILFALPRLIRLTARRSPSFRDELRKHNCLLQFRLKNNSAGRCLTFSDGQVSSTADIHPKPDAAIVFKNLEVALQILTPFADINFKVFAAKNFLMTLEGSDPITNWALQMVQRVFYEGFKYGEPMADGSQRYTTITNGGPLHVYVKDDKILRTTPIDFSGDDAESFSIKARGDEFAPKRQATVAPHALATKGVVYSRNRLLYPMKRVDFDPGGERNPQNRGISGYQRISWDEALDIVAKEIKRQKREHGPGAIFMPTSSHHQWGNIGYYLSAHMRFGNCIGFTRMVMNPDSWEGWFWGAQHHVGHSLRAGAAPGYGTVEDCMKEADQIVFWSSDPEGTNGVYGGFESTQRRLWARQRGMEFIHIDPHKNPTAQLLGGKWIPIRPQTDAALAMAVMNVWITEELYDKDYVADKTTGFDEWKAYLLGEEDGVAKTPEWQESETGVPARDTRALARSWANKNTYLGCGSTGTGFGGACRGATGAQWARCMVMMMAMQGWGKPGINMGQMTQGAPVDLEFYFPGYADGGISGDTANNGNPINNYQRMQHVVSMNPVQQLIPK